MLPSTHHFTDGLFSMDYLALDKDQNPFHELLKRVSTNTLDQLDQMLVQQVIAADHAIRRGMVADRLITMGHSQSERPGGAFALAALACEEAESAANAAAGKPDKKIVGVSPTAIRRAWTKFFRTAYYASRAVEKNIKENGEADRIVESPVLVNDRARSPSTPAR